MFFNPFTRQSDPHLLAVSMTGVKMGDRVVFVGCADGGRLAAVAGKVGLSGRAVAIVADERTAERVRKSAAKAGVLVETEVAPPSRLPLEDGAADLAIVDETADVLGALTAESRPAAVRELIRVLRPGGRVVVVGALPPSGVSALIRSGRPVAPFASSGEANAALSSNGFAIVRTLAEREGLVFVEGIKPRA